MCVRIYIWIYFGRLRWCSGLQARLANLHEWVRVSLGAPFKQPCDSSKQARVCVCVCVNLMAYQLSYVI